MPYDTLSIQRPRAQINSNPELLNISHQSTLGSDLHMLYDTSSIQRLRAQINSNAKPLNTGFNSTLRLSFAYALWYIIHSRPWLTD